MSQSPKADHSGVFHYIVQSFDEPFIVDIRDLLKWCSNCCHLSGECDSDGIYAHKMPVCLDVMPGNPWFVVEDSSLASSSCKDHCIRCHLVWAHGHDKLCANYHLVPISLVVVDAGELVLLQTSLKMDSFLSIENVALRLCLHNSLVHINPL